MQQRAEEYQGEERKVTFVRRYDDRLWAYCRTRFQQRWELAKPQRAIPQGVMHEGEFGWWFPDVWVADFVDRFGAELRSRVGPADFEVRAAKLERLGEALEQTTSMRRASRRSEAA